MIGQASPVLFFLFREDGSVSGMWSLEISTVKRLVELGMDLEYLMQVSGRLQPSSPSPFPVPDLDPRKPAEPEFECLRDKSGRPVAPTAPEFEAWFKTRAPASFDLMSIARTIYNVSEVDAHTLMYRAKNGALTAIGRSLRREVGRAIDALRYEGWPVTETRSGKGQSGKLIWNVGRPAGSTS